MGSRNKRNRAAESQAVAVDESASAEAVAVDLGESVQAESGGAEESAAVQAGESAAVEPLALADRIGRCLQRARFVKHSGRWTWNQLPTHAALAVEDIAGGGLRLTRSAVDDEAGAPESHRPVLAVDIPGPINAAAVAMILAGAGVRIDTAAEREKRVAAESVKREASARTALLGALSLAKKNAATAAALLAGGSDSALATVAGELVESGGALLSDDSVKRAAESVGAEVVAILEAVEAAAADQCGGARKLKRGGHFGESE